MGTKINLVLRGAPVASIRDQIKLNPHLWNEHPERTENPDSPHHGLDDIWCRFAPPTSAGSAQADCIWYPNADVLGVRPLCLDLMRHVSGTELGGVLITRIPPGAMCKPHTDDGWHARKYQKFGVQIEASPGQRFHFEGESLETAPGDVFWFDNAYTHWVTNETPHERITMIVCIRMEG